MKLRCKEKIVDTTGPPSATNCDAIKSLPGCDHFVNNLNGAFPPQKNEENIFLSPNFHSGESPLTKIRTARKKCSPSKVGSRLKTPPPQFADSAGKKSRPKTEVKCLKSKKKNECPLRKSPRLAAASPNVRRDGNLEVISEEFEFSHKILVSNIPLGMSVPNLEALFSKWGRCQIEVTSVAPNLNSQWAIVCYASDRERKLAFYQNWSVLKPKNLKLDLLDLSYRKLDEFLVDKKKPEKWTILDFVIVLSCLLLFFSFLATNAFTAGRSSEPKTAEPIVDKNVDTMVPSSEPQQFSDLYGPKMNQSRPANCLEIQVIQNLTKTISSSPFKIYPFGPSGEEIEVACDLLTGGGGWTIIQRRSGPGIEKREFWRTWSEYEGGFGSPDSNGNYWIGLSPMAALTHSHGNELMVTLKDWDGHMGTASYENFFVSGPARLYQLSIGGYHDGGDAGDSLAYHNGQKFSTHDLDHDEWRGNCAVDGGGGGWWYRGCQESNLNGPYITEEEGADHREGIQWQSWRGLLYSLKETEMKIRPRRRSVVEDII